MTWEPITCEERERLVHAEVPRLTVLSSITDPSGEYGSPRIFTEWGLEDETPVLRDERWPGREWPSGPDECETCAAASGRPCVGFDGVPRSPHGPRRRAAEAAVEVARMVDAMTGALPPVAVQDELL